MVSYFKHILKSHLGFLIFAMIFIPLIQFLIIEVFTGLETKPFIDSVMKMLPPQIKMMVGDQFFSSLSIEGAVGFGLNHPVVLMILIILLTAITSKHIAGAIENGTMELLLALPVKRTTIVGRIWLTVAFISLVLILFAMAGLFISVDLYDHLHIDFIEKTLKVGLNLWVLMMVFMSFSLMISTFMKESGRTASLSSIVILVFYFIDMLSGLWKPLESFKPYNIFHYYQPQNLMTGQRSLDQNLPVLVILILIFSLVSHWQFQRRDI